jgi:radical S-adenosyl methionine domain-containing protein 2
MEIVYNWHMTEMCNYSCKYCFSEWQKDKEIWGNCDAVYTILKGMKYSEKYECLKKLAEKNAVSSVRVNFVGGEPLIAGDILTDYAKLAKDIGLRTSLITNGSLLFKNIGIVRYIDILGISIDSFEPGVCRDLGRCDRTGNYLDRQHLTELLSIVKSLNPNISIKFNTVVSKFNYNTALVPELQKLKPGKIKILREMPYNENSGGITDEMFRTFIDLNCGEKDNNVFIEDNPLMTQSYLMIDPSGRFFQNGYGKNYKYSSPIYEIGFENALKSVKFNSEKYLERYGHKGE